MEGRGRGLESETGNPKTQTPPAAYLRLGCVVLHRCGMGTFLAQPSAAAADYLVPPLLHIA